MSTLYETTNPKIRLFLGHEVPETIYSGAKWNEGPAYFPAQQALIWSDIPNGRLMRYDELTGSVGVLRQPSNHANGNTVDRLGRLVTCEHGARRVTRTEHDGSVTVLADAYGGKKLNSPNDVVVKSDGTIWFSDPTYGIDGDYFGNKAQKEQPGSYVYRYDPASGALDPVITTMIQPNGLAFSADESRIYVVDSSKTDDPSNPAEIRCFDIGADGSLTDRGTVCEAPVGVFDGFRIDEDDRMWAGTATGVSCYSSEGELLGSINLGGIVINLTFGGPKRNILYMCGATELFRVHVRARGQNLYGDAV
ncbi:MAG: SMP-30/gluconolactonase/LRE family protein [Rhodobacteraceae bacterium]|nr:SMP-30/gluconolactonase/LRE family protein [Paracoccaceae bacterium]MBR9823933.1 SMP-30/gluconolactonase/LRE family protein [Paracoccaceae bacterium]